MKTIRVRCDGCGAPISVPENARFVTCRFCSAELSVAATDSAVTTSVIREIANSTAQSAQNLELIRLHSELERLDREFEMQREALMITGKNGHRYEPSAAGGILALVVGIGGGLTFMIFSSQDGAPGFFPLFGLLFAGVGVFIAIQAFSASSQLRDVRNSYFQQRRPLEREISASTAKAEQKQQNQTSRF